MPFLPISAACLNISSQVFGGFGTRSLRYQSSCVLLQIGAAQSLSSKRAVSATLGKTPSVAARSSSPVHCSTQPALANSPVQITSMPMMSIELSSAPSRRTSCSRCWSASEGRYWKLIVYSPFEDSEQASAISGTTPLGSLKMKKLSSVGPLDSSPPPQAERTSAAASRQPSTIAATGRGTASVEPPSPKGLPLASPPGGRVRPPSCDSPYPARTSVKRELREIAGSPRRDRRGGARRPRCGRPWRSSRARAPTPPAPVLRRRRRRG